MKRLFGTDGIRGVAGERPLDPDTVRRFGAALARVLCATTAARRRIVLGRDTRESGPWLRDAVATGASAGGAAVVDAGVITTPGLAHVVKTGAFDAGVMISASHNPFEDNGLKVFGADGTKLPDRLEGEIEASILDPCLPPPVAADPPADDPILVEGYLTHLAESLPAARRLDGLRLVVDCANGSAASLAPAVFSRLGARVTAIGDAPDGRNINLGCGSLHLEALADTVRREAADIGIAFDGDADRALAVDRRGRVVDGDHILYLAARGLARRGTLTPPVVVATVMSNLWLEARLRDEGIRLARAAVGDKYVYERMLAENAMLGGEQSGHVIFRDRASTGDGILTALRLLDVLRDEDRPLEAILDSITPFPQVLINVQVREKPDLAVHPAVGAAVRQAETALGNRGRVLLRYSGTEPLARVMVEGEDETQVRALAEELVSVVRRALGA